MATKINNPEVALLETIREMLSDGGYGNVTSVPVGNLTDGVVILDHDTDGVFIVSVKAASLEVK